MTELTEMQNRFVAEIVSRGCPGAEAARSAGYAEAGSPQEAYRLLRNPAIQAAIKVEQRRALSAPASRAIACLAAIIDNPDAPWGVRVDACRIVMDRAGLVAPKAGDPDDPLAGKKHEEMSIDELRAIVWRLGGEAPMVVAPPGSIAPPAEESA